MYSLPFIPPSSFSPSLPFLLPSLRSRPLKSLREFGGALSPCRKWIWCTLELSESHWWQSFWVFLSARLILRGVNYQTRPQLRGSCLRPCLRPLRNWKCIIYRSWKLETVDANPFPFVSYMFMYYVSNLGQYLRHWCCRCWMLIMRW